MLRQTVRALLITALCISVGAYGNDAETSDEQILLWLQDLEPLQKVHYSYPLDFKTTLDELLYEYARITHAVSISGEWHNRDEIDQAVRLCKRVNQTKPQVPATIAVNYSPWHHRFGKDLPPTNYGPTHEAELEYVRERMEKIRTELARANRRNGTDIPVTAVLLNTELFKSRKDDAIWNDAIAVKYNAVYDIVRQIFPQARIEWYARGAVQPAASESGWSAAGEPSSWFTLKEKGEYFSTPLYRVPEIGYTRETFRRTAENANQYGVEEVTPWVALASGYRRHVQTYDEWTFDWDYDLAYSWKLGAEINQPWFSQPIRHERFAPWNRAKVVVFYPPPFDKRVPHWGKHFVAYARGANMMKVLPDVLGGKQGDP